MLILYKVEAHIEFRNAELLLIANLIKTSWF